MAFSSVQANSLTTPMAAPPESGGELNTKYKQPPKRSTQPPCIYIPLLIQEGWHVVPGWLGCLAARAVK
jgi:hypothetical protein